MRRQVDHRGRVSINLRLPLELLEALEKAADERAVGRSWLAERLISEGMARLIPVEDFLFTRPGSARSDEDEDHPEDGGGDEPGADPVGGDAGQAEEPGDGDGEDRGDGDEPQEQVGAGVGDDGPAASGSSHVILLPGPAPLDPPTIEERTAAWLSDFPESRPPVDPIENLRREYPGMYAESPYRRGGWAGGAVRPPW